MTIILHHIEKSTQDGIKPKYKIANRKKNVHKIHNIEFDNDFLDRTPKAQATKAKLNKRNHAKPKSFCTGKETTDKMKKQPTGWEKIFANHISDKAFTTQYL